MILVALVLALIAFLTPALAEQDCPTPFPGAVPQQVEVEGRNVTLFAATFYEKPGKPPERTGRGARWVPGSARHLCSVSTFMELPSSGEGGWERERESRGEGEEASGDLGGTEKDGGEGEHYDARSENNAGESRGGGREAVGDDDPGPADVTDCIPLYTWAAAHHGHWIIPQRGLLSTPLLLSGFCTATVSVRREWRAKLHWGVAVSSEDVARVMRGVVEEYREGIKVGARGGMGCLGWGVWEPVAVPVDWRVGKWEAEDE